MPGTRTIRKAVAKTLHTHTPGRNSATIQRRTDACHNGGQPLSADACVSARGGYEHDGQPFDIAATNAALRGHRLARPSVLRIRSKDVQQTSTNYEYRLQQTGEELSHNATPFKNFTGGSTGRNGEKGTWNFGVKRTKKRRKARAPSEIYKRTDFSCGADNATAGPTTHEGGSAIPVVVVLWNES
eukprot:scaffold36419_cov62-Phaeocystis_antarctica.AAC.6